MSHPPFKGTDRFETRRLLGSGTSGAVYEVWDRQRDCSVALKLLHQGDPAGLYRFKQEFRALAHLSHPNLIQFYELQHENNQWFVTMELVDGVDFVSYVRDPKLMDQGHEALEARLRDVARQLALGLRALHGSGRLHCDIKPSNVLVDSSGKVVILDFGLVTKATALQTFKSFTEDILGTPAYMAPEQGGNGDLTEAIDWYAMGALMYEALAGLPPFSGQFIQVMLGKQASDPPPPRTHEAAISADLDGLCGSLLRRDPSLRPGGLEILEALGVRESATRLPTQSQGPPVLIGREASMDRMWDLFGKVLREQGIGEGQGLGGEAVVLYVHGASGLGKTALVQGFLLELRQEYSQTITLSGRCYEHESVPYKAFDNMIDMLTRYLRSLPESEVVALLPRDVLALARLFPVLRRVGPIADAKRQVLEISDPLELRRRAFAALREILTRMAEDHPLVLFIDDLQWGDYDSAGLLSTLMRPPDAPPLMLIAAYRDEDAATSVLLRELLSSEGLLPGEDLEVRELEDGAARELAARLLAADEGNDMAREIADESRGNPLFIGELVRHALAHGQVAQGGLDEVFRARMSRLPAKARHLLEVLAVSGQPTEINVARRAAGLEPGELSSFTLLRVGNLARSTGARDVDQIGVFDDRVRKAVLARMAPARRRACHQHLARELESAGWGDLEALAQHFAAAGEAARSLEYMTSAARGSAEALAFNRAARLYRRALDLQAADEEQERDLRGRLAEAYESVGRGTEAAEIHQQLAEGAPRTGLGLLRGVRAWWRRSRRI